MSSPSTESALSPRGRHRSIRPIKPSARPRVPRRQDASSRRMQVDRAGSDVSAPRYLAHAEVRVAPARDLAQGGRLDRARCSRGPSGSFALNVTCDSLQAKCIGMSKLSTRCAIVVSSSGESRIRLPRAGLADRRHGPGGLRAVGARPRDVRGGRPHRRYELSKICFEARRRTSTSTTVAQPAILTKAWRSSRPSSSR